MSVFSKDNTRVYIITLVRTYLNDVGLLSERKVSQLSNWVEWEAMIEAPLFIDYKYVQEKAEDLYRFKRIKATKLAKKMLDKRDIIKEYNGYFLVRRGSDEK